MEEGLDDDVDDNTSVSKRKVGPGNGVDDTLVQDEEEEVEEGGWGNTYEGIGSASSLSRRRRRP